MSRDLASCRFLDGVNNRLARASSPSALTRFAAS